MMTDKVLKHLVDEYKRVRPFLKENIKEIESNLKNQGYIDIGLTSKASIFRIGTNFDIAILDIKKPEDLGRYQIRLWKDRTGIIDWDNIDPDGNPIKAALHVLDVAYYLFAEVTNLLPFDGIKLAKNYIVFKY